MSAATGVTPEIRMDGASRKSLRAALGWEVGVYALDQGLDHYDKDDN
jgi:hypothetical protein